MTIENKEPSLWPEDPLPEYAAGCEKCELCGHRTRIIWGEGSPKGELIVLLDNPGRREDNEGNPFVCGARQALQAAAYAAGFDQNDIYVTYILNAGRKRRMTKIPRVRNA